MDVYCPFSRNLCQHVWLRDCRCSNSTKFFWCNFNLSMLLTLADSFAFHGCQNATSQGGVNVGDGFFVRPNRTNLLGIVWGISTEIFCWIVKTKCKEMVKYSKTTTKRHGSHQKISNQFFLPFFANWSF